MSVKKPRANKQSQYHYKSHLRVAFVLHCFQDSKNSKYATVPFIARYRKEATGGLDDAQLRLLEERLGYLRELEE